MAQGRVQSFKGLISLDMRTTFYIGSIVLALSAMSQAAEAQKTSVAAPVKKPKPIRSEISAGFRLNSDGWSGFIDRGIVKSKETKYSDLFHNIRLYQVELSEHKDPKEIKRAITDQSTSGGSQKSKPFVFGKINNFYTLKLGYGIRKMIAGKPEPGTVSIHLVVLGGLALGMEKPYYVDGYIPQDNFGTLVPATFKYTDSTKSSFLNEQYLQGSAGFAKGLGEIQFVPGLHFKTALHFDFAASRHTVLAVETGINLEYYTKSIQIMANQDGKAFFGNLFASFQFGRRI